MSYHYTDPKRESETYALPDVEVFHEPTAERCEDCSALYFGDNPREHEFGCRSEFAEWEPAGGYYYAFGFPGCLWDSEPVGPFETEAEALEDAREAAGVYDVA